MVEARDLTYQKTALIEENMARCGVTNMKTLVWDALEPDPSDAVEKADIVIADLPCSGLGIIGRKPDIKYNMTPGEAGGAGRTSAGDPVCCLAVCEAGRSPSVTAPAPLTGWKTRTMPPG